MEQEYFNILKENLVFDDIKKVDPAYYKNVKYKVQSAEQKRDEEINKKVMNIVLILMNKIQYGCIYSDKTEKYLLEVIYPLLKL